MIKIVRFNLSLMLGFVLTAATASAAATLGPFRAPAIPLFTTDPYMQTWMMGDNTTAVSGNVKKKRRKRKAKKKACDNVNYAIYSRSCCIVGLR